MNYFLSIIFLTINILSTTVANAQKSTIEIDITKGRIELIPIAINNFYGISKEEKELSKKITNVITNDLINSGLFKELPKGAFLQPQEEVFLQPVFKDWRIIDAHILVSGQISIKNNKIIMPIKVWDVYGENLMINKKISGVFSSSWRTAAHIISNLIYQRITGEKGYFDTKIAYISEKYDQGRKIKRLAIMDQDGENHLYLTDGKYIVLTPRFSPVRQELVYLSYSKKTPRLYLYNLENGKNSLLGSFSGMTFAPRYSPDGNKIALSLSSEGNTNIFILELATNKKIKVTNNRAINTSPSFSPDSKYLVFSSDRSGKQNLYVKNLKTLKTKRITFNKGNYATPVWSPRGDYIAFTKTLNGSFFIGLIKTDGTKERIISKGYLTESPSWSPNGRTLAFYKVTLNQDGSKKSKLYAIDITGNKERLIKTPNQASDPAWGPSLKY